MKKFLRNKIDLIKRNFQKGEKFEKFAPAVNAFDTLLFVPNHYFRRGIYIGLITILLIALGFWIYGGAGLVIM